MENEKIEIGNPYTEISDCIFINCKFYDAEGNLDFSTDENGNVVDNDKTTNQCPNTAMLQLP